MARKANVFRRVFSTSKVDKPAFESVDAIIFSVLMAQNPPESLTVS